MTPTHSKVRLVFSLGMHASSSANFFWAFIVEFLIRIWLTFFALHALLCMQLWPPFSPKEIIFFFPVVLQSVSYCSIFLSHSNFYLFPSHRVILRSVFRAEILLEWKHYQLISHTGFIPYCSKILSYARIWSVSSHNKNIVCQSYFRIFLFFLKNMVMLPVHSSLSCNKTCILAAYGFHKWETN